MLIRRGLVGRNGGVSERTREPPKRREPPTA